MPLPERVEAVFCDVGGPIYSDENFAVAVLRALDEIRADQGRPPVDPADFDRIEGC
jgi:putative hydrolase of the HAD superfamily